MCVYFFLLFVGLFLIWFQHKAFGALMLLSCISADNVHKTIWLNIENAPFQMLNTNRNIRTTHIPT